MHPDIATAKADAAPSAEEMFLDDCRFAKVVSTPSGEALLIGGKVFHVAGPYRPEERNVWAERLAVALRKIDVRQTSGLQPGTLPTEPLHQATADFVRDLAGGVRGQLKAAHASLKVDPPQGIADDPIRLAARVEKLERQMAHLLPDLS